ncbi:MAG: ATP-dependent helicase Lhr [Fibrobacteres bacterium]|nr:ATP-dependent helicase Lhr [Fibrobacterota bacterium]
MRDADPITLFHPLIQAWFREKVGTPTDIQMRSWPRIAEGRHVLLTAPTGSGKTLTAFLWALDRFATGAWASGATRILYVSPLKALNNDIQRNLISPLEAIRARFTAAGAAFPEVRVLVRSGDTPANERRRMLKHPPEILITTPESLNLLLLSRAGRDSLSDLSVVILDEIHAVAGTKRGTHLITAVDRLVPLAGEFQRIAISATVKPMETVAAWAAGFTLGETGYVPRPMESIRSRAPKAYELHVRYPVESAEMKAPGQGDGENDIWAAIALELKGRIAQARSTLIFANNRRLSERLARLLNEGEATPIAYAHHGSLSREIRNVVEARMKEGSLPAIVATNSLELGIDVGALDQVILVQTPFSIASALQRIGRAGHGVGQTSRGYLYASHGRDLLDAAAAVKCVLTGDLEDTRIVEGPLDLLAQIMVSMAVSEDWTLDRLYAFLRTSHPYRNLPRAHFDLVAEMLAGRFEATRIRELRPRLYVDAVDGRIRAAKGAALLVGLSGGTIPDRGLYTLRHAESRSKIGELDEEFVWERREGDVFALGSQSWRIVRITANEVEAVRADQAAQMAPFWRAEERDRGFHLSNRLAQFLESAEGRMEDPDLKRELMEERGLEEPSAAMLIGYLRRQRAATRSALPHRHHLLIEDAGDAPGGGSSADPASIGGRQIILHAIWGGRLNRPWAYAMAAAYEARHGLHLEIITGDDCLLVRLPDGEPPGSLIDLVHSDELEALLRKSLERTGWFAAHFRENAARALLLPRSTTRARIPLWLNRLRSQNLLQAVSGLPDFPIVLETWRECLRDEFDLPALKAMLDEVHSGAIKVSECRTTEPSPFGESLLWKQTNKYMYEQDKPAGGPRNGREDLLREIAFSAPLRPRIPREVIADFEAKSRRLAPGYAPETAAELVEWIKERLLLPWEEWRELLPKCGAPGSGGLDAESLRHAASRLLAVKLPGAGTAAVAAVETLPRLMAALRLAIGDAEWFSALRIEAPPAPAPEEALAHLARLAASLSAKPGRSTDSDDDPYNGPAEDLDAGEDGVEEGVTGDGDMDPALGRGPRLAPMVSQWLRAYGPMAFGFPRLLFGRAFPLVEEAWAELAEGDRVVLDALSEGAPETEICDAANLEILLRLMRRRSRPEVRTLPAERLPLFLAAWQGLTDPSPDVEGLQASLEKLFGYPAPAAAWEAEFLPARSAGYLPSRLDELFRDSDLLWAGRGKERIAFAFPEDLELFPHPGQASPESAEAAPLPPDAAQVMDILSSAAGRLDFQAIAARCPLPSDRIGDALWDLAWLGRITNDTFAALRKGVENGFKSNLIGSGGSGGAGGTAGSAASSGSGAPSRRQRFQRWKAARPLVGAWQTLEEPGTASDALEQEELSKDRVRQALRRYGVLFRELLGHELPAMQWSAVFRSLRLLELSGEVLSGHFFAGIPGMQFISPQALRMLEAGLPDEAVFWMSAADPASPCALGLEGLPYPLPPRLASTHLVFHGAELTLISRRMGRDLAIRVPPRHKFLSGYLSALRHLVDRAFLPAKSVEVEIVNGEPVMGSPYMDDLLEAGFEQGIRTVTLRKRY